MYQGALVADPAGLCSRRWLLGRSDTIVLGSIGQSNLTLSVFLVDLGGWRLTWKEIVELVLKEK